MQEQLSSEPLIDEPCNEYKYEVDDGEATETSGINDEGVIFI